MISIIKKVSVVRSKLDGIISKLKGRHHKRVVAKLRKQAEAIDVADELFIKRLEIAQSIFENMEARAIRKCDESYQSANQKKEELFAELEELRKL